MIVILINGDNIFTTHVTLHNETESTFFGNNSKTSKGLDGFDWNLTYG